MLTIYDITSAICRYNKINIEKIYIIGKGPKRAIRLLGVKAKSQKIENIKLNYVEIPEILHLLTFKMPIKFYFLLNYNLYTIFENYNFYYDNQPIHF